MDINQLKYFIGAAQSLNFSETARRYGLTQPSISHHITELEKYLDCRLFLRDRRNVSLTDAGRAFLPYATNIVDTAEKACFAVGQMEKGATGHLAIASLTTITDSLSRCLTLFYSRFPEITVDISLNSPLSQAIAMNGADYDIHFCSADMIPSGTSYNSIFTHRDKLMMAFPAYHPLAGKPLDFSALRDERFIATSETEGPHLYRQTMEICSRRGYTPNITCKLSRTEAVLLAVGSGLGIGIVPENISKLFHVDNVALVEIPGDDVLRSYAVAWRRNIANPATLLFLTVVRELFAGADSPKSDAPV